MNAETPLMARLRIAAGRHGAVLFRNLVGKFKDERGTWWTCGLGPGSSDLIGWTRDGRFLAVECKVPGSRTDPERRQKQEQFIQAVRDAGGLAGFAEDELDLIRILHGL